ncbi:glucose-1-phosphate adenylyltransferase family protein [Arthrobacter halodurans]|uniref:Glucose-1-phosphate adenylyltransferase family protein n=1 Tax=Arthrobacter halodurans TaxID=516699 RepID=A0ABV4UPB7_9MICC
MRPARHTTGRPDVLAVLLAGGRGSRLAPLTDGRSKPATPFGGVYRLIDFQLSNIAHSGIRDVWVVEQFRPFTLNQHLAGGRPWDLDGTRHGLRILPPAEGGARDGFAEGNAHALYQQAPLIRESGAGIVVVLSADHLCTFDLRDAIDTHRDSGAELTIVTTEVEEDPSRYSVVQTEAGRVTGFDYKPASPRGNLVATEIFVYSAGPLIEALERLAEREREGDGEADAAGAELGDYGESLVPSFVERGTAVEHRLEGYWRDVGTVDSFYRAHMELLEGRGVELARPGWPVLTNSPFLPPAHVRASATVAASLLSPGCDVGGRVEHSVLGPNVVVEAGAVVSRSVLLGDTTVPAGARLESVVADVGARFDAGARVGRTKPGPGNITVVEPS